MRTSMVLFSFLICLFLAGFALGGDSIPNWAAPASWTPTRGAGVHTLSDATPPLPFIGLPPCRILDTRGNGAPIQGGIFTGGSDVRSYTIPGRCGVPAGVGAVSLNFTVTGPGQTAAGFLLAWPTGGAVPPVSILNWDHVPAQVANAAVVPTNGSGSITVNVSSPTHAIMDINGYYAATPATGSNYFKVSNSGPYAIFGQTSSAATDAVAVYGLASSSTGLAPKGVWGDSSSNNFGIGVFGRATSSSGLTFGVYGRTQSTTDGATGTYGEALGTSGITFGVEGVTASQSNRSAGVLGLDGGGDPGGAFLSAGVRGSSGFGNGVLGTSRNIGVKGVHVDIFGNTLTAGFLAVDNVTGVYAYGDISATGNIYAMGAKPFVDPHPTDVTKEIAYVALEGPEAGTYFRGRGRIHNGTGVITVPESFRLVSDEEGLTVQITPIGQVANMAVLSADLNAIAVQSSAKDLEFYYVVNGVRKAFKDWEVIAENRHYVPEGPEAKMPRAFAPEQRRRLIATGIYNEDGTVNLETA